MWSCGHVLCCGTLLGAGVWVAAGLQSHALALCAVALRKIRVLDDTETLTTSGPVCKRLAFPFTRLAVLCGGLLVCTQSRMPTFAVHTLMRIGPPPLVNMPQDDDDEGEEEGEGEEEEEEAEGKGTGQKRKREAEDEGEDEDAEDDDA